MGVSLSTYWIEIPSISHAKISVARAAYNNMSEVEKKLAYTAMRLDCEVADVTDEDLVDSAKEIDKAFEDCFKTIEIGIAKSGRYMNILHTSHADVLVCADYFSEAEIDTWDGVVLFHLSGLAKAAGFTGGGRG